MLPNLVSVEMIFAREFFRHQSAGTIAVQWNNKTFTRIRVQCSEFSFISLCVCVCLSACARLLREFSFPRIISRIFSGIH